MKRVMGVCGVVLSLAVPLSADAQTIDETAQQFDRDLATLISYLQDIHDQSSATAASERVTTLDKQVGAAFERLKNAKMGIPDVESRKRAAKRSEQLGELERQLDRIAGVRRAADVLDMLPASKAIVAERKKDKAEAKVKRAKADVTTLAVAAQGYEIQFNVLPDSLQQLLAPPNRKPYLESPDNLIDPWGRPYHYDAKGPKNHGLKPDVWSDGPDPKDKTKIIGNWPAGAK